jgi:hypothetical protein
MVDVIWFSLSVIILGAIVLSGSMLSIIILTGVHLSGAPHGLHSKGRQKCINLK